MQKLGFRSVARPCRLMPTTTLTLVGIIIVACATKSQAVNSRIFDVFEGFIFVGTNTDQAEAPRASRDAGTLAAHGNVELPWPQVREIGIRYVFHHRRPVDNLRLALVDLPARLRAAGISVVDGPKSGGDLAYPFVGGPLFEIKIAIGGHEGRIYNQLDPNLLKSSTSASAWEVDDYVVLWLK